MPGRADGHLQRAVCGRKANRGDADYRWALTFFVASSAASSAYLTVSEIFPLEIRALAIAIFYACGTFAGGVFGPALYGYIVGTGSRTLLFWGYMAGAAIIACGGVAEILLGVDAERKSLESIASPLASRDAA
jgi:MFS family permease